VKDKNREHFVVYRSVSTRNGDSIGSVGISPLLNNNVEVGYRN